MNIGVLIAFAIIGAVLGLAIGFVVHKATGGIGDFVIWISPGVIGEMRNAVAWTLGGTIVGAAVGYIRGRMSN